MPISFTCPACSHHLKVADAAAGQKGICPACKEPVLVPSAKAADGSAIEPTHAEAPSPVSSPSKVKGLSNLVEMTLPPRVAAAEAVAPALPPRPHSTATREEVVVVGLQIPFADLVVLAFKVLAANLVVAVAIGVACGILYALAYPFIEAARTPSREVSVDVPVAPAPWPAPPIAPEPVSKLPPAPSPPPHPKGPPIVIRSARAAELLNEADAKAKEGNAADALFDYKTVWEGWPDAPEAAEAKAKWRALRKATYGLDDQ